MSQGLRVWGGAALNGSRPPERSSSASGHTGMCRAGAALAPSSGRASALWWAVQGGKCLLVPSQSSSAALWVSPAGAGQGLAGTRGTSTERLAGGA